MHAGEHRKSSRPETIDPTIDLQDAELICEWDSNYPESDFRRCHEALYQDCDKRFFLVGQGGSKTIYAKRTADGYKAGWGCRPLSEIDVLNWLIMRDLEHVICQCLPKYTD